MDYKSPRGLLFSPAQKDAGKLEIKTRYFYTLSITYDFAEGAMSLILFLVLFCTLWLMIEVFSIVFKMTGLELSKSRFQIISILTHTGFTTRESELVVQHPLRRRIASLLMIVSYVAQASLITLLLDMFYINSEGLVSTLIIIGATLLFIIIVSRNKYFTGRFDRLTEKLIGKSMKKTDGSHVDQILNLSPNFSIYEFVLDASSPMCNKTLRQARLKDSFIQVLKIDKGHKVIDFPTADTVLTEGDRMVVYGRIDSILKIIMNKSKKSKTEKRVS